MCRSGFGLHTQHDLRGAREKFGSDVRWDVCLQQQSSRQTTQVLLIVLAAQRQDYLPPCWHIAETWVRQNWLYAYMNLCGYLHARINSSLYVIKEADSKNLTVDAYRHVIISAVWPFARNRISMQTRFVLLLLMSPLQGRNAFQKQCVEINLHLFFHLTGWWIYNAVCLVYLTCSLGFSVPPFSQERCQQTADHAAEEETLQESNHPGLQNFGCGSHQHGWGSVQPGRSFSTVFFLAPFSAPSFLSSDIFFSKPAIHSAPTVIDMALSVSVAERASCVSHHFRWFMLITHTAVWDYWPSGAGFICTTQKPGHLAMLCRNSRSWYKTPCGCLFHNPAMETLQLHQTVCIFGQCATKMSYICAQCLYLLCLTYR